MKYRYKLKNHFYTPNGWMNDPNGLVYFKGKYHVFYQHYPNSENPQGKLIMHWGHAVTEDFINWQHLPAAISPDELYDRDGCWSGTATVKDDVLYIFYSSCRFRENSNECIQSVSVAYSHDGINFTKYEKNPIIAKFPKEGSSDFRDPAIMDKDNKYYLVMATGNVESQTARLLVYESEDLFNWKYLGIMSEWQNSRFAECPSFVKYKDKYLLTASVCKTDEHFFTMMYGDFDENKFTPIVSGSVDKGPDQYAGQIFTDNKNRAIMISWIPGWSWKGILDQDIGCLSVPKEIILRDGKLCCYPVEEVQHLLKDTDENIEINSEGFIIKRTMREPVIYKGEIHDIKILRDEYIIEVFVNGGESVYTAVIF